MRIDLLLVRHGEATPYVAEDKDSERTLTSRGLQMAAELSEFLSREKWPIPQVVVTSGYKRAEETKEGIVQWKQLRIIRNNFLAPLSPPSKAISFLEATLADVLKKGHLDTSWLSQGICLGVVGHNPSLGELRGALTRGEVVRGFQLCEISWLQGEFDSETATFGSLVCQLNWVPS